MSSNIPVVIFKDVWKKYSKDVIFHRSFREDLMGLLTLADPHQGLLKNEFWALKKIDFSLEQGQIIGLWGSNGAGKSTLLKLVARITYPTLGQITIKGAVAPIIEVGAGFHPDLTGRENVYLYGVILGMTLADVNKNIASIIGFSQLNEFIDMPIKKYSSGMYMRLAFSIAIHSQADIYVIDEVLMTADESWQKKLFDKIQDLKKQNKSILLVTQNKQLMESTVDRIMTLDNGQIIAHSLK